MVFQSKAVILKSPENRQNLSVVKALLFLIVFAIYRSLFSQSFTTEDYYLFPINPGQTNYLAGTMGEMRGTHFHGGIDIRTGGQIGLPVYATADGYISRISVQLGGYGHCLYMKHPNGTTSVYAHLDHFSPGLEKYLIKKQYEEESYVVNLFPRADEFKFSKGEVIAYSGNSGSSSGPHLHFEIRDKQQRVLDPLKFNFSEITDRLAPTLKKIAFVTLDQNARVNGAFGRYEFNVYKIGEYYRLTKPINLKGRIGIQILYQDKHNGSGARNGIPEIVMSVDDDTVFHQKKTRMAFGAMRNIVVHMDYPTYSQKRQKFNKLYRDQGNNLTIYLKANEGITFDEEVSNIKIMLIDSYGNKSTFDKNVNHREIQYPKGPTLTDYEIVENVLQIKSGRSADENITILANGLQYQLQPYFLNEIENFYLWPLDTGLPDMLVTTEGAYDPNFISTIPSDESFQLYHRDIDLDFGRKSLFKPLNLRFKKEQDEEGEYFNFLHPDYPVRQRIKVTLKPELEYNQEKAHVYSVFGSRLNFQGGDWNEDQITFKTRDLVKYTIAEDLDAPKITPVTLSSQKLQFVISDELSGIKSYSATLDGEWFLMKYDSKKKKLVSQPKTVNKSISGEFILEVEDNAGNKKTYRKTISNS